MINWEKPGFIDSQRPIFPWLVLMNVILATVIGVISAGAGFVAESTIRGALQLSADDNRWIGISFIMMLGMILPLAIWLAERYGYKRLLFLGIAVFALGSLLNALSFSFWTFMISRMIAGAGAGALFPVSIAVLDQTFPKEKLTVAVALYVGLGFGFGTTAGFLVGGFFTQYLGWQAPFFFCFLLSLPLLLTTWILHQERYGKSSTSFDFIGYITFTIFLTCVFLVLASGKAGWNTEGWTSPFIITTSVIGILSLAFLIPYELRHPNPLIIFSLFKIRTFLLGCTSVAIIGAVLYSTQILSSAFFDLDLHYEKKMMGLYLSIQGVVYGVVGSSIAFLTKKINIGVLTLIGMGILTISCWMNNFITINSSHNQLITLYVVRMIGVALSLGPATALSLKDTPLALGGAAAVFITFARQIGGTIGSLACQDIIIQRSIFHAQMYGAQVKTAAPRFKQVIERLQNHITQTTGASSAEAHEQATALIKSNVITQAHTTAMNDAFWILGILTGIITLLFIIEMILSMFHKKAETEVKQN